MERKEYVIESELGEIRTHTHYLRGTGGQPNYNSGRSLFEGTASREKFKSDRMLELMLDYSTDMSDRAASRRLNRIRHESKGIIATTYRNIVEREGQKIAEHIEKKCDLALEANGFSNSGDLKDGVEFKPEAGTHIPIEILGAAAAELRIKKVRVSEYEHPENAVNISADDVCVKRQTETRPRPEKEQPKRVDNSVIHVESNAGKYILNSSSVVGVLKLLLGFLLCVGLSKKQLVFFTDGAREIHNQITRFFAFANYKIILDWYHLAKKCREQLSMALKNANIRNEFLKGLLPCLWFGNVGGAIKLLHNIDPKLVKNFDEINKLVGYFERCRHFIPCYALRKELGLRNSSNSGEKVNDLIVSSRQKHNGMSWSDTGSRAFASVAAVSSNQQIFNWIHFRTINFDFVSFDEAL